MIVGKLYTPMLVANGGLYNKPNTTSKNATKANKIPKIAAGLDSPNL